MGTKEESQIHLQGPDLGTQVAAAMGFEEQEGGGEGEQGMCWEKIEDEPRNASFFGSSCLDTRSINP